MARTSSVSSVKGKTLNDAVTLFVGGNIFSGWKEVSVNIDMNSISSSFSISLVESFTPNAKPIPIVEGSSVSLNIGGSKVLTGFVDSLDLSISGNSRGFSVNGRSKSGDLVDCSYIGKSQYKDSSFEEIISSIISPFSIEAKYNQSGGAIEKMDIRQGENCREIIERLCRREKLIVYPSADGSIVFDTRGNTRSTTEIKEGINLLGGRVSRNMTSRFSEYTVKSQTSGANTVGAEASNISGTATDLGVNRYRPLLIMSDTSSKESGAQGHATYEAERRAVDSLSFNVNVQGWFQKDGTLWQVNQVTYLESDYLNYRGDVLIKSLTFNKDESGTTTSMVLTRADAFGFASAVKQSRVDIQRGEVLA